ncbi:MAG TPA: right-handed parallel beta-helix repeat-containing protein [Chloroflexota bacterium]|nr:right-handed parallel beta-helix repeat-containing protein [Chloroflexota bacterium]
MTSPSAPPPKGEGSHLAPPPKGEGSEGVAQQTLCQLLASHGRALCHDPRRVEALLRDLCGEQRRAIFVLVNALRERVAADLMAWPAGVPQALLLARLTQRLCDALGFAPEVARWAVETWALALAQAPAAMGGPSGQVEERSGDRAPPGHAPVPPMVPAGEGDLTVAPEAGAADFTRIGEAIRSAAPGSRILVRPGVYAEGLVLDRPVEIVGAGLASACGEVVVECTETSCLRMETEYAVVRGLVLRGLTGLENRTLFAVDVPQGRLVLEDCAITSDALACVAIHGRSADPLLRRCQVHDGRGSGVFVHHGGMGTLEDCAIFGHALAGVEIGAEGCPTLRRCQILDGKGAGVYVSLRGSGLFEDCTISGNAGHGVEIGWQGNPVLRRCRLGHNGRTAVRLYAGGGGTFEACDLSANTLGAWEVEDGRLQHAGAIEVQSQRTRVHNGVGPLPEGAGPPCHAERSEASDFRPG